MSQIFLSPDVYLSLTAEGAVFLDVKRDQYVGLGVAETSKLMTLTQSGFADEADTAEVIDQLMQAHLLKRDGRSGRPIIPTAVRGPQLSIDHLLDEQSDREPRIRWHHLLNFIIAYSISMLTLKCGSLKRATQRVQIRNEMPGEDGLFSDIDTVCELVMVFRQLGPIVFRARDNCLLDSMMLLEFLARYGIRATWMFGVKTAPFQAHCWVQRDDCILNGSWEHVAMFKSIMAI